jgi:hypothetical protein
MEEWLEEAETDPDLLDCIAEYAHGQGERTMTEICSSLGSQFIQMAKEQDAIGWRWFMEGMICGSMRKIQYDVHYWEGTKTNPNRWAQGLILKLLNATHGQWQWIYCEDIPTRNLYAVTQHLLTRRNFIFLKTPRGFRRSLEERSHNLTLFNFSQLDSLS